MKTRTVALIICAFYAVAVGLLVYSLIPTETEAEPVAAESHFYEKEYAWFFKPAEGGNQPGFGEMAEALPKYGGICVASPDEKTIYLTFDSGFEDGSMPAILDVLKEKNVPAAFFITGHYARANPDLIKRMQAEGHLVCNHTDKHKNGAKISTLDEFTEELAGVERACADAGVTMSPYYRPSEGVFSERTLDYAQQCGYKTVFWSFAYVDWKQDDQPDPEYAVENFMSRIHPGAIVLLHSTSATNAKILPQLINGCVEQGYAFKSLDDLDFATGKSVA